MNKLNFSFAGHQTFPVRQMWLYKAYIYTNNILAQNKKPFADTNEAMLELGVGKNMVDAIKFWAKACGILDKNLYPTQIANFLYGDNGVDKFAQNPLSTYLFHYLITKDSKNLTVLWYVFNIFNKNTFTKEDLESAFHIFLEKQVVKDNLNKLPAFITIKRDLDTILNAYAPKSSDFGKLNKNKKTNNLVEEATDSLFAELNLIYQQDNKFIFNRSSKLQLNIYLFTYCLIDYYQSLAFNNITLDINRIAYDIGSPGRIFKLDELAIEDYLIQLNEATNNNISWDDQSGIRQIVLHNKDGLDKLKQDLLLRAYQND